MKLFLLEQAVILSAGGLFAALAPTADLGYVSFLLGCIYARLNLNGAKNETN